MEVVKDDKLIPVDLLDKAYDELAERKNNIIRKIIKDLKRDDLITFLNLSDTYKQLSKEGNASTVNIRFSPFCIEISDDGYETFYARSENGAPTSIEDFKTWLEGFPIFKMSDYRLSDSGSHVAVSFEYWTFDEKGEVSPIVTVVSESFDY